MEHKNWLWRRKPSEKTITVNEKSDSSLTGIKHEKEKTLELERSLEELNEKLLTVRAESNAKDDLLTKQAKVTTEAIAGWEKAEAEAASFKQELDDALLQRMAAEKRVANAETTMKECMHQLHIVKEEQQHIINDAMAELCREQERTRFLEEMLAETNATLAKLGAEHTNLSKTLDIKEKFIADLSDYKFQSEENLTVLLSKFDMLEKNNSALRYEVCMLQKELDIRNEERDFSLKAADAARKQQLENMKNITKLETECQKLRAMLRKRLPGPAAVAKMRSEVEMLANTANRARRKKPIMDDLLLTDLASSNDVISAVEKLLSIEEENKILKETLTKKSSELQSSRVMFARTVSKLSKAESQLQELSKQQACLELAKTSRVPNDLTLAPISEDLADEDGNSCAESWASALISELECFRNGKQSIPSSRTSVASDLSLMDDFVEMERFAIVTADKALEDLKSINGASTVVQATGKDLIIVDSGSVVSHTNNDLFSNHLPLQKYPSWLQEILRVIVEKQDIAKVSIDFILEMVRVALNKKEHTSPILSNETVGKNMLTIEGNSKQPEPILEKSVYRVVDFTETIIQKLRTDIKEQQMLSVNDGNSTPHRKSSSITGYVTRIFLFKSSELSDVLQNFISVCNGLMNGKDDLVTFLDRLSSTLDWIINHCFSLQDVSHLKESVKELYCVDEAHSDNEFEAGSKSLVSLADKVEGSEVSNLEQKRSLSLAPISDGLCILSQVEEIDYKIKDENRKLKWEILNLENRNKDVKEVLNSTSAKNESLITQLKKSEEKLSGLQAELEKLKESKGLIEDQVLNQKLCNDDLNSQLRVAKVELSDAFQKLSSIEVELEEKSNCCEELETTCLELQLQLESVSTEDVQKHNVAAEEKQLRTEWEISAASEKLAECQETILSLGKQLKALASPKDAALLGKAISTQATAKTTRHLMLLDQMRTEDDAKYDELKSPEKKEMICTEPQNTVETTFAKPAAGLFYGQKVLPNSKVDNVNTIEDIIQKSRANSSARPKSDAGALAVMPKRQKVGFSLLRKFLYRKKRGSKNITLVTKS